MKWHEVKLERTGNTREEVMRKIEAAIEAIVKAERPKRPEDPENVQDAVSGAIAENIAIFALDNSVPGPGQVRVARWL